MDLENNTEASSPPDSIFVARKSFQSVLLSIILLIAVSTITIGIAVQFTNDSASSIVGLEIDHASSRFYFVEKDEFNDYRISSVASDGSGYNQDFMFDSSVTSVKNLSFDKTGNRLLYFKNLRFYETRNLLTRESFAYDEYDLNDVSFKQFRHQMGFWFSSRQEIYLSNTINHESAEWSTIIQFEDILDMKCFDVTADGKFAYILFFNKSSSAYFLLQWDVLNDDFVKSIQLDDLRKIDEMITTMSISPDGKRIAFITVSPFFGIFELDLTKDWKNSKMKSYRIRNNYMGTEYLYWAADGKHLFNYGRNKELFMFTLESRFIVPVQVKDKNLKNITVYY